MKTFLLMLASFFLAGALANTDYAARAKEAATAADCLGGYDGKLSTSERVQRVCENGLPEMDSYVTRACEEEACSRMRIRPFARVSFVCSDSPKSVTCL